MTNVAYVDSVMWKIACLLKSFYISREIAALAMKEMEIFEELLIRMSRGSRRRWNKEIRAAIKNLRDAVQSHVSKRIHPQSGDSGTSLEEVKLEIYSFAENVKKMEEALVDEVYQSMPDEEEDGDDVSSSICSKMVGISDLYRELKSKVINDGSKLKVFSMVGMGGIGKTALARNVYEDRDVVQQFDLRVWLTIGRECGVREIPRCIVTELYTDSDQMVRESNRDDVIQLLRESLKGKKYLIVLDDVWGKHSEYYLQRGCTFVGGEMKNPFPDEENGSRVVLTSRLLQVDESNLVSFHDLQLRLLNKEESWDLLREKVFGEELCPFILEKIGKKIAENCDGLPLTIVTIARLLSEEEKILEYWSEIAASHNHQIFLEAYDQVSKVLLPSYKYLPRMLQMCFLYMGVFPKNYEVYKSKLIHMWETDGFLAHKFSSLSEEDYVEYVDELVINNLIVIHKKTRAYSLLGGIPIPKICGLHSSLGYLSIKEGGKTKFFHVINSINDGFGHGIEGQHSRLSFHSNILLGLKDVHKSVENNCASTAHSFLCYGPYQKYPVPICFGLRLLTKLDALTIRFYDFPMEVVQLCQLKYLTLTLDGKIPSSISQLLSLQFLIVNQHLRMNSCSDPSYLPIEIWDMKELRHLQIMGSDLPSSCGASLDNLSTLSNVSALSCAEGILTAIPNLNKLGIRIELNVDEDGHPSRCLDHISRLTKLRSLKCVVVNPELDPAPTPFPIFPSHLQKLSLSGLGYSWKELSNIAFLPNLYMLKLRNYAFKGPVWEVKEEEFFHLCVLVIEDTDLVEWKIGHGSFKALGLLSLKHCYNLERIEGEFAIFLENIEVDECGPLAEICAEQIRRDRMRIRDIYPEPDLDIHSTWNDGYHRT